MKQQPSSYVPRGHRSVLLQEWCGMKLGSVQRIWSQYTMQATLPEKVAAGILCHQCIVGCRYQVLSLRQDALVTGNMMRFARRRQPSVLISICYVHREHRNQERLIAQRRTLQDRRVDPRLGAL